MPASADAPPVDRILLGFATALRAAGVAVTADRTQAFLTACSLVGAGDAAPVHRAGRATLCSGPDDLQRFDQVFEAYFLAREGLPRQLPVQQRQDPVASPLPTGDEGEALGETTPEEVHAVASQREVLARRDVATLEGREKALLDAMIRALHPRAPRRRALRRTPFHRGEVDVHRTLRTTLRQMGEPGRVAHRRRGTHPRRVVLLVDVSASMKPYADALLRLAHRIATVRETGKVEVFTLGTRLTRITRALHTRDAEQAMVRAAGEVSDWSGGTRLGETLRAFNDRWGARGMARGAVVVVCSDGWEKGDARLLGEQVARLHRLAHEVIWLNPHRGKDGYQPVQGGITAVLPHVDHFVAGHSLRSFAELLEVVADA